MLVATWNARYLWSLPVSSSRTCQLCGPTDGDAKVTSINDVLPPRWKVGTVPVFRVTSSNPLTISMSRVPLLSAVVDPQVVDLALKSPARICFPPVLRRQSSSLLSQFSNSESLAFGEK